MTKSSIRKAAGSVLVPVLLLSATHVHANAQDFAQPTGFIENKGQIIDQRGSLNPDVLYLLTMPGFNVQLRRSGFSYDFYHAEPGLRNASEDDPMLQGGLGKPSLNIKRHRVDFELEGLSLDLLVQSGQPMGHLRNYYTTGTPKEGITGVRQFDRVVYRGVYPHIDLEFLFDRTGGFKYNFLIHPGGDPRAIRLRVEGATFQGIEGSAIRFGTFFGDFIERVPECTWRIGTRHGRTAVNWTREPSGSFGFELLQSIIPNNAEVIIDPVPDLVWGTYFGGEWQDLIEDMAISDDGDPYVTGGTVSESNVATAGAFQDTIGVPDSWDGFLARFDASGDCIWATYIGGDGIYEGDGGVGIAVDAHGNAYITGFSTSSGLGTSGVHQEEIVGEKNIILAKFTPTGLRQWLTYYGTDSDEGFRVAVDDEDNVYVTGFTRSESGIATGGAFQTQPGGAADMFLAKFTEEGGLLWGTYIASGGPDCGTGLALSADGKIFLSGYVDYPGVGTTVGTFDPSYNGGRDAVLMCFSSSGARIWATYFGSAATDDASGVCVDQQGNVYMVGTVGPPLPDELLTPGAFLDEGCGGPFTSFLVKFNGQGERLWSTLFGGYDHCVNLKAVALDMEGGVYIAGQTDSQSFYTSIATPDAYQTEPNSPGDCVLARFNGDGQQIWATYYGGEIDGDYSKALAPAGVDGVYLAGATQSATGFATPGTYQDSLGNGVGIFGGFLARFSNSPVAVPEPSLTRPFLAYPNPTPSGSLSIRVGGMDMAVLFDSAGKTLRRIRLDGTLTELRIDGLDAGLYTIRLSGSSRVLCERVVVLGGR